MKSSLKMLSILAIGGVLAGTSFAGPSEVTNRFAAPIQATPSAGVAKCSMATEQARLISTGSAKNATAVNKVVTGYTYPGCARMSTGAMSDMTSGMACATTSQGS